ncbi:MAG: putative transglycosylase, partial [Modestobacter sp.]|nr:putative transglycosylase [Modestobacter sp.]
STWAGVGGSGDPAEASAEEQTMRAQMLYARSGAGQWGCGSHLFD